MPKTAKEQEDFRVRLEELGEDGVRRMVDAAWGSFTREETRLAELYLEEKERKRAEATGREEMGPGAELVGHADNANRIARRANWLSAAALIVSIGALIASLIALRR